MKRLLPMVLQTLLAGWVLTATGCKEPVTPMEFNNRLAGAILRLADSAKQFYKGISNADAAVGQTAYIAMQKALQDSKKEIDALEPQTGSAAETDFLAKARDFMLIEQTVFDECITPMMQILKDNTQYPDKVTKTNAITPLMAKALQLEKPAQTSLVKAQAEYCKQNNLEPR